MKLGFALRRKHGMSSLVTVHVWLGKVFKNVFTTLTVYYVFHADVGRSVLMQPEFHLK